jgi:hypothetical protein
MRQKQVWRYWCDYCKKAGLQKAAMIRHETHCTLNPNRRCRVCDIIGWAPDDLPKWIAMLPDPAQYKKYDSGEYFHGGLTVDANLSLPSLRKAAGGCPACIMAAIRLRGIPVPMVTDFNFTDEMKKIWRMVNAEQRAIVGHVE